jgi:hypothetical protein
MGTPDRLTDALLALKVPRAIENEIPRSQKREFSLEILASTLVEVAMVQAVGLLLGYLGVGCWIKGENLC